MTQFRPSDNAEAAQVVAWAAAEAQTLEIVGGGSKRALGRPPRTDHTLDVSRLSGIVDYEPSELVLTARAATPLAEIEAQLAANRQVLAFEPPDWRALG
jgi:glycolate oxidase FAD binding subunit